MVLGFRVQGQGVPGNLLVPSRQVGEALQGRIPSAVVDPGDRGKLILNNFYIRAAYQNDLSIVGEKIVALARVLAPKFTGDLARTIRFRVNPQTLDLTLRVGGLPAVVRGGRVWYAQAIERGVIRVHSGSRFYMQQAIASVMRTPVTIPLGRQMLGQDAPGGGIYGEAEWHQRFMRPHPTEGRPQLHLRGRGKRGSDVKLQLWVRDRDVHIPKKSTRSRYKLADRVPYGGPEQAEAYARGVEYLGAGAAPLDLTPSYRVIDDVKVRTPREVRRAVRPLQSEAIWLPSSAGPLSIADEARVEGHLPFGLNTGITRRAATTSPHKAAVATARRRSALLASEHYRPSKSVMERINEQRGIFGQAPLTEIQISRQYRRRATEVMDPYGQLRFWDQDPYEVYRNLHLKERAIAGRTVRGRSVGRLRRKNNPLDLMGPKSLIEQQRIRDQGMEILEGAVPISRTQSWRTQIKDLNFQEQAREPEWIKDLYEWAIDNRPDLFE